MPKFNAKNSSKKVVNLAGGIAFKESPKLELVSLLLTSFVNDKFYEKQEDQLARLRALADAIPEKKFLGKAAIYSRQRFGMRSISQALAAEVGRVVKGETWTKNFYNAFVSRPDDITETLSYYLSNCGEAIPNSMKKGFAKALTQMSSYELAKYRMENRSMKLVDAVNLVHPKPTEALNSLVYGKLKITGKTWEAKLSEAGQEETEEGVTEAKASAWLDLLKEDKLGYFALLRNLRNIVSQSPEAIPLAAEALVKRDRIKKSRILPFQFLRALDELQKMYQDKNAIQLTLALNKAIDIAVDNVPKFDGNTLVVLDESGSMDGQPWEIGSLFAAVLAKSNLAPVMLFADNARFIPIGYNDSVSGIRTQIKNARSSGGTNFHAIFEKLTGPYDRIIILSDMQGWIGYNPPTQSFADYKKRVGKDTKIYSFDLNGHGTLMFPEPNVYAVAGFSEKVFDLMGALEEDRNAMIHEIEKITL